MTLKQKRILAAEKAVNTLRLNLLATANLDEVKQLCIEIKAKEYSIDDDVSRSGIIAKEIGPTTWKSFCRFGDRRSATPGLILYWINNKAMSLDEQAMWISENYNMDILPDELASFMLEHERGKSYYSSYSELSYLHRLFKEITGFNFNHSFVNKFILQPGISCDNMPF